MATGVTETLCSRIIFVIGHIYIYEFDGYHVSFKHSLFSVYGTHHVLYVLTYLPIYLFILKDKVSSSNYISSNY